MPEPIQVCLIDLDGTLLRGNSHKLWLEDRLSHAPFSERLFLLGWIAVRALRLQGGQRFRQACLRALRGLSRSEMDACGEEFFQRKLASRLNAEVMARAQSARAQGAQVLLVTAAAEVFAKPVARAIGADGWIATELEFSQGRFTGRFAEPQLLGDFKLAALRKWAQGREVDWQRSEAYSDERSDAPMLSQCGNAWLVRAEEGGATRFERWAE